MPMPSHIGGGKRGRIVATSCSYVDIVDCVHRCRVYCFVAAMSKWEVSRQAV